MPLYEYQCDSCASRFERIQKFSDPPIEVCPSCEGPVRKLLSSPAIQFKGSGWYITDYARKAPASNGKGTGPEAGKSGDAPSSTDSKPAGGSSAAPSSGDGSKATSGS